MDYLIVKWLHIVSSTILFGTGIGSAFYMLFTSRTRNVQAIAVVTRHVVIADWLFTAPAVLVQPLSGWYLMARTGWPLSATWLRDALALYAFAIACWIPVVWLQMRMRNMARRAAQSNEQLPQGYWRYLSWWIVLGSWAFVAFVVVFFLMVAKPT
jgi:uncharacterized membrane protein